MWRAFEQRQSQYYQLLVAHALGLRCRNYVQHNVPVPKARLTQLFTFRVSPGFQTDNIQKTAPADPLHCEWVSRRLWPGTQVPFKRRPHLQLRVAVQPPQAHAGRRVVTGAERHAGREDDIHRIGVWRFRPVRHDPERPRRARSCSLPTLQCQRRPVYIDSHEAHHEDKRPSPPHNLLRVG